MLADALAAFREILTPPFRAALAKVLGLTLLILIGAVALLDHGLLLLVALPYPWLSTLLSIVAGLGLLVGSVFLVAPVSSVVAGFFIDDLAEHVERDLDPLAPPGRPLRIVAGAGPVGAVRCAAARRHRAGAAAAARAGHQRRRLHRRQRLPARAANITSSSRCATCRRPRPRRCGDGMPGASSWRGSSWPRWSRCRC